MLSGLLIRSGPPEGLRYLTLRSVQGSEMLCARLHVCFCSSHVLGEHRLELRRFRAQHRAQLDFNCHDPVGSRPKLTNTPLRVWPELPLIPSILAPTVAKFSTESTKHKPCRYIDQICAMATEFSPLLAWKLQGAGCSLPPRDLVPGVRFLWNPVHLGT